MFLLGKKRKELLKHGVYTVEYYALLFGRSKTLDDDADDGVGGDEEHHRCDFDDDFDDDDERKEERRTAQKNWRCFLFCKAKFWKR